LPYAILELRGKLAYPFITIGFNDTFVSWAGYPVQFINIEQKDLLPIFVTVKLKKNEDRKVNYSKFCFVGIDCILVSASAGEATWLCSSNCDGFI
jgi:hypothetical protein